jgi:hypothetical protein
MDKKRVIFFGTDTLQGVGAEWPRLAIDCKFVPKELLPANWEAFMKKTEFNFEVIQKEYKRICDLYGFAKDLPEVVEFREGKNWPKLVENNYKDTVEVLVPKLNGQSLFTLSFNLISGIVYEDFDLHDLEDTAVILALPDAKNDIMYRAVPGQDNLENITIWNYALTISRIRQYVEDRGGNFYYFHLEDWPKELYDDRLNPLLHHIKESLLFENSLYSYVPGDILKRKYNGFHLDGLAHNTIKDIFIQVMKKNQHLNLFK